MRRTKEVTVRVSRRIEELPTYPFAEIDRRIEELRKKGVEIINFGIGDPHIPTPPHIVEELRLEAARPEKHR
jgi:LL-diaminopimelate aminotransferase